MAGALGSTPHRGTALAGAQTGTRVEAKRRAFATTARLLAIIATAATSGPSSTGGGEHDGDRVVGEGPGEVLARDAADAAGVRDQPRRRGRGRRSGSRRRR